MANVNFDQQNRLRQSLVHERTHRDFLFPCAFVDPLSVAQTSQILPGLSTCYLELPVVRRTLLRSWRREVKLPQGKVDKPENPYNNQIMGADVVA